MALRLSDLTNIPTKPGVYIFSDVRGKILYIGKAKNLKNRLSQYFQKGSVRKQDMLQNAEKVEFHIVTTESEALFLEDNLIKKHIPPYNSLLKADNSYAYIKVTNEEYPQIFLTRFRDNDGSTYIGPKNNTRVLREMLHFFRQLFEFRGCKKVQFHQGKLCSDYFFGLCEGRCIYSKLSTEDGKIKTKSKEQKSEITHTLIPSPSEAIGRGQGGGSDNKYLAEAKRIGFIQKRDYAGSKEQYKKIISLLVDFFGGKTKTLSEYIMDRLNDAIAKQHFEYAAQVRDMYTKVDMMTEKQNVVLSRPVTGNIVEIKSIGEWRVCCMVKLYEGKIIDIIRYKQHKNDGDVSSLAISFNREVGELNWNYRHEGKVQACKDIIACDEGMQENAALLGIETNQRILNEPLYEIIALLERSIDAYVLTSAFEKDNLINELLKTVETRYGLRKFPYTMECLDISHLSGGWVSGGLSAMKEGLPNKKGYRRYKVKGSTNSKLKTQNSKLNVEESLIAGDNDNQLGPMSYDVGVDLPMIQSDDYASLTELLTRRFNLSGNAKRKKQTSQSTAEEHGGTSRNDGGKDYDLGPMNYELFLPDLFIIDGGKGQLGIVKSLFEASEDFRELYQKVQFVSLGKGEARERSAKNKGAKEKIYMFDVNFRIVEKELCYDDADRIIIQLRDEAHRFANAYRKKQMSSERSDKNIKKPKKK